MVVWKTSCSIVSMSFRASERTRWIIASLVMLTAASREVIAPMKA
jgi:hypothetical protein